MLSATSNHDKIRGSEEWSIRTKKRGEWPTLPALSRGCAWSWIAFSARDMGGFIISSWGITITGASAMSDVSPKRTNEEGVNTTTTCPYHDHYSLLPKESESREDPACP